MGFIATVALKDLGVELAFTISGHFDVVGPLQPILAAIGGKVESGLLENTPMETIVDSIAAEIERAEREGIDIEAYAVSGVTHQITRHPLPVTTTEIDRVLRHAKCLYEAEYTFTTDENRPGVYMLHDPDCTAQAVTFLPEVSDRYPEAVRYLTYTDEVFEHLLATALPMNGMPGVERIECGNDIAYVSSMGNVGTINALEVALEHGDVIPAPVVAFALERLAVRSRAEKTTIDGDRPATGERTPGDGPRSLVGLFVARCAGCSGTARLGGR